MNDLNEPETIPDPGAADSGSSPPASSTSDPFVGDAGPGFAPGSDPGADELGPELAPLIPEVSEDQVRGVLRNLGDGTHAVIGVGQLDWVMTDADLQRIAPPLTRIVNRHPELAVIAAHSDELAVAIGAGLFTWRSLLERQAVLRAQTSGPTAAPAPAPAASSTAAAPTSSAPGGPAGPIIETPADYVPASERLRATRPPEASP